MRCPSGCPPPGPARARVGVVAGCVQRVFFPGVNEATLRVLAAEGCEVLVPARAGLLRGAVDALGPGRGVAALRPGAHRAVRAARRWRRSSSTRPAAARTSRTTGELFRNDPAWAERARAFSAKVKDVHEFLAALGPSPRGAPPHAGAGRVPRRLSPRARAAHPEPAEDAAPEHPALEAGGRAGRRAVLRQRRDLQPLPAGERGRGRGAKGRRRAQAPAPSCWPRRTRGARCTSSGCSRRRGPTSAPRTPWRSSTPRSAAWGSPPVSRTTGRCPRRLRPRRRAPPGADPSPAGDQPSSAAGPQEVGGSARSRSAFGWSFTAASMNAPTSSRRSAATLSSCWRFRSAAPRSFGTRSARW